MKAIQTDPDYLKRVNDKVTYLHNSFSNRFNFEGFDQDRNSILMIISHIRDHFLKSRSLYGSEIEFINKSYFIERNTDFWYPFEKISNSTTATDFMAFYPLFVIIPAMILNRIIGLNVVLTIVPSIPLVLLVGFVGLGMLFSGVLCLIIKEKQRKKRVLNKIKKQAAKISYITFS